MRSSRLLRLALALASSLGTAACSSSSGDGGSTYPDGGGGAGRDSGGGGPVGTFGDGGVTGDGGVEPTSNGVLTVILRDFKLFKSGDATTNADFENVPQNGAAFWDDREIVTDTLGSDGKPVYKNTSGTTLTTHGAAGFNQWYKDTANINLHVEYPLPLVQNADGAFEYDSEKTGVPLGGAGSQKMFFPMDDGSTYQTAFGNQGDAHNYSFTAEIHTKFTYRGGEFFSFRGDDDVFVYIDKKRVINLGGIHDPETARVECDSLGLTKGETYPLDFFFAERHKGGSNVLFTTTLKLTPVVVK